MIVPQPNFSTANPAHISSLGLGVPQLHFPMLTAVHQQSSVSDCPVIGFSDAMAIDHSCSCFSFIREKTCEINSPLPAEPSLRTTNLTNVTVAGTYASMRINAEAGPSTRTSAFMRMNAQVGPSTVRHSEGTSAVNTGTSDSMRVNAEAGPSTVRHSEGTSAVNSGFSASASAEGLHTTAGPSGPKISENPLASIPEVHLPGRWEDH